MPERFITLTAIRARQGARVPARLGLRVVAVFGLLQALLFGALLLACPNAAAEPIKADVTVNMSGGYARLVFRFSEEVDADVRLSNGIVVVTFKQPVNVAVDRLNTNAVGYVSAARRDPDSKGLRIALARKVSVNSMVAGERLFVDLLPDTWTAAPPGLPQEVVEELAKRAREAERRVRQERQLAQQKRVTSIRLRVSHQPTFTRYVFDLPELIAITSNRSTEKLTLVFDAPLKFDFAEAKAAPPPMVESIEAEIGDSTTSVNFGFIGNVDIRAFREDNSYVVDVGGFDAKSKRKDTVARKPAERVELGAEQAEDKAGAAAAAPAPDAAAVKPTASQDAATTAKPVPKMPPAAEGSAPAVQSVAASPEALPPAAAKREPDKRDPDQREPERGDDALKTPRPSDPNAPVTAELRRQADTLRLSFPFAAATPTAIFRRADTLWLVFDSAVPIDVAALNADTTRTIRSAAVTRSRDGQVVRIKLERPRLTSLTAEGTIWTVIVGDIVLEPSKPMSVIRNINGPRATALIPFDDPRSIHRLSDPEVGDTLIAVTGLGPARGLLKTQDFVEFRALSSTHGVVVQPLADDVNVELAADKVVVGRPSGLTLSTAAASGGGGRRSNAYRAVMLDAQTWGFDRQAPFQDRQVSLLRAAAAAPEAKRAAPRLDLARFYLSRDMFVEAKAVLDVTLTDERPNGDDSTGLVMRAVANVMLGRSDAALRDLSNPLVGNQHDAPLWRALAFAKQGKWAEAREGFRHVEVAMGTLPIELQRLALKEAVRASIEARDFAGAAGQLNEFETLGVPKDLEATISVLAGRLAEGLGRHEDALVAYRAAAGSSDRPAAALGRLHELELRYELGDLKRPEFIAELETLTTVWRGDDTEVEALQLLAHLYTEEGRYREAFYVMRTALTAHPNSELTRRIQDEAATTFDALFLSAKGDAMPAIEALSLFYDFRELTPIGRRGDEMIRRLSDRLVSVDLLDQAAELLQHQVDHRLQGAARAQVATRLAVIYLMNRKPDRALAALRATRTADLSNELRNQRLLIEARGLSDTGRHDLALEVVVNMEGREAIRLRSDILWSAHRWREASEQVELLYGDRWRDFRPLDEAERADLIRAGIGYALGEDTLGIERFRGKYAAKMADSPDRRAFDSVTSRAGSSSGEFREIARMVAAVDTLEGFLREMRARYPDSGVLGPAPKAPAADAPAAGAKPPAATAPQSRAPLPDSQPTGTISDNRRAPRGEQRRQTFSTDSDGYGSYGP